MLCFRKHTEHRLQFLVLGVNDARGMTLTCLRLRVIRAHNINLVSFCKSELLIHNSANTCVVEKVE